MPRRRKPSIDAPRTAFIILEYCGGARTDALHSGLTASNPGVSIFVLDNASPSNRASCITHRNETNSYVGGGIRACVALAESMGAEYLFYCANDVTLTNPLVIADFQAVMDRDPDVVMVTCALTPDSAQAAVFPWMVRHGETSLRRVRFADPICCLLRLDFLRSFGGFPTSMGGWGYSSEFAFHAMNGGRKIVVNDRCSVRHTDGEPLLVISDSLRICKATEAAEIYRARYGGIKRIRTCLGAPGFDETMEFQPSGHEIVSPIAEGRNFEPSGAVSEIKGVLR